MLLQKHCQRSLNTGFSLVEIMVAMVIGLLGIVVIFQVLNVFEGQKRTTTASGDAQQNGLLALFSIEREARMSGYGLNYGPFLGCAVTAYDAGPPVRDPIVSPDPTIIPALSLTPAQIIDGPNNTPDSITLVYGNSDRLTTSVPLLQPYVAGTDLFTLASSFGFTVGDTLVVGEVGKGCSLATMTSTPAPQSLVLNFDPGTYTDIHGASQVARYNKAGGIATSYAAWSLLTTTGGRMLDLGPSPTVVTYFIQNSKLMATYLMQSATPATVVEGIVQMQAQYGVAKNNSSGVVDDWNNDTPTNAAGWAKVLAMRVVVVARSGQPERPKDAAGNPTTGACNTTTVAPVIFSGAIPLDLTADPDWQCYRYRTFETTVPLRNQIWAPA
jgi:type IV pilus assembly protein PilW